MPESRRQVTFWTSDFPVTTRFWHCEGFGDLVPIIFERDGRSLTVELQRPAQLPTRSFLVSQSVIKAANEYVVRQTKGHPKRNAYRPSLPLQPELTQNNCDST